MSDFNFNFNRTEPLKPGFLDQVFNSTIGLPQQLIWRMIRVWEDDEIDFWSEKGILDAALIPGFGMFDSHEHDVMPDYMAEQLGMAEEGESGFGSQIGAAILTDPLTYLTGGLSALGKMGKMANKASTFPTVSASLLKGSIDAGVDASKYIDELSPKLFGQHLDEGHSGLLAAGDTVNAARLDKIRQKFIATLPGAEKQALIRNVDELTIGAAVSNTTDRKLALGLPLFSMMGLKINVAPNHSSWWKLFKDGVNYGGRGLGKAFLLKDLVNVPYVGAMLKGSVMPFRHGMFGWKHGQDARAIIPPASRTLEAGEAQRLIAYASEDGGKHLSLQLEKVFDEDLVGKIQGLYSEGIKQNMTHEQAFKAALASTGVISTTTKESGAAIWGRLSGLTKDNKDFPDWGDGFVKGRNAIAKLVGDFRANHRKATAVLDSGEVSLVPTHSAARKLDKAFELERKEANALFGSLSEGTYQLGKFFKGMTNKVFKSASSEATNLDEAANAKLLSSTARDNDQVEVLSSAFFKKLVKISKQGDFSLDELNKIVELRVQLAALPEEIAASFKSFEVNSSDPTAVLGALKNYLDRHRSSLSAVEKLLKHGGIKNKEAQKRLLALFSDEVFPFIETTGRSASPFRAAEEAVNIVAQTRRAAEPKVTTVIDYTPQEGKRLQLNHNAHVVGGEVKVVRAVGQRLAPAEMGVMPERLERYRSKIDYHPKGETNPQARIRRDPKDGELYFQGGGNVRVTPESVKAEIINEKKAIVYREARIKAQLAELDKIGQKTWDESAGHYTQQRQFFGSDARPRSFEDAKAFFEKSLRRGDGWSEEAGEWLTDLEAMAGEFAQAKKAATLAPPSGKAPNLLGDLAGRQVGTLTDAEVDSLLVKLNERGSRSLTDIEILKRAEDMTLLKQFAKRNKLTIPESVALLRKKSKARKTQVVKRPVREPAVKLWDKARTRWSTEQANSSLANFGLRAELDEATGMLNILSKSGQKVVKRSYRTYNEVMRATHNFLKRDPAWMKQHGPGLIDAQKRLAIPVSEVAGLRKAMLGDDLAVLSGKTKTFDADMLSEQLLSDFSRLSGLAKRRQLPPTHALFESPIIGKSRKVRTEVRGVGTIEDIRVGKKGHEIPISETMSAYATSRVLLKELADGYERAQRHGVPFQLDAAVLADLEANMVRSGAIINDLMAAHLPKEMEEAFDIAQLFSSYNFQAARRSGTWLPGSPVAYLPRYLDKTSRTRTAKLIGELDAEDGAILTRLGIKQRQYFKRTFDNLTVDDLEDIQDELRVIVRDKTASPIVRKIHKELDEELVASGLSYQGVKGKYPATVKGRLSRDPFLSLIQRLGVANQHDNLADYFNSVVKGTGEAAGESLMVGGKVVGVVDDTGKTHRLAVPTSRTKRSRVKDAQGEVSETLTVSRETDALPYSPKHILIETADGKIHEIPNAAMDETGFGLLRLHDGVDDIGRAAGAEGDIGNAFAHASMRSDLHNSITQNILTDIQASDLLGQQVVFGSRNHLISTIKAGAEIHKIAPQAVRTFDSINYMIKSFQTIFRIPFHIANLASGVFQASLAGASPKNLLAGYSDTIRLLFGRQHFARQSSKFADLLDVGGETASLGIWNLMKGDKALIQQAVRLQGGGKFSKHVASKYQKAHGGSLDAIEHLVIKHADGSQTDLVEFLQVAGEMQLYGTFASSLSRGSSTIADNLMRIKLEAIDPTSVGFGKKMFRKWQNRAETSEIINRTATALALIREGHPMKRAIEITRQAHVPYEKLTKFERNVLKRVSVYYTFPRHYMPWATARFAEDPIKLSRLEHLIRDQTVLTSQEGSVTAVAGDYRINIGRLNANIEAAGMLAAFADRLVMPGLELVTGNSRMDRRFLRNAYSASGLTSVGGLASFVADDLIPQGERTSFGSKNMFDEAVDIIWPIKAFAQMIGYRPSKEESSPYVNYTNLESMLTDAAFGPGMRKVRDHNELRQMSYRYKSFISSLKLKIAATDDEGTRRRYMESMIELTEGYKQLASESAQKERE